MNMNGTARGLRHMIGNIITELYGSKVLMNSVLWDVWPSPPTRPALTSQLHKTKKLRKVKQKLNQKPSVLYFIIHCTHSVTQTICAIYLVHCIMGSLVLIILQWLKVNANFQFVSRIFFQVSRGSCHVISKPQLVTCKLILLTRPSASGPGRGRQGFINVMYVMYVLDVT